MHSHAPGPRGRGHDVTAAARSELLADFSLGMTGKEVGALEQARTVIPPATRVHVGSWTARTWRRG